MKRTLVQIPKMDCLSEEKLVRMALQHLPDIKKLTFNLDERTLTVHHGYQDSELVTALAPLNFGAKVIWSELFDEAEFDEGETLRVPRFSGHLRFLSHCVGFNT